MARGASVDEDGLCSASEVQSQLYIALDQAYITDRQFHQIYNKADEAKRLINGFVGYLKQPKEPHPTNRPVDQTTKRPPDQPTK
jgi:hypothetical protein